jgi:hypothetical protein
LKDHVEEQFIARYQDFFKNGGKDASTLIREAKSRLRPRWSTLDSRLTLLPGKMTLRRLREKLSADFGISLSDARIVDALRRDEIAEDIVSLMTEIDQFRIEKAK